jgi:hypothetical protein
MPESFALMFLRDLLLEQAHFLLEPGQVRTKLITLHKNCMRANELRLRLTHVVLQRRVSLLPLARRVFRRLHLPPEHVLEPRYTCNSACIHTHAHTNN